MHLEYALASTIPRNRIALHQPRRRRSSDGGREARGRNPLSFLVASKNMCASYFRPLKSKSSLLSLGGGESDENGRRRNMLKTLEKMSACLPAGYMCE